MKIKEIKRTANVAWSPKQQHPIYLAAGTAAQQLDASFSTSAALDIYHVNLENKEFDMPVVGSLPSEHRFHKLLWSDCGMESGEHVNGLILGGTDNGELCVIDASAILNNQAEDANIETFKDHSGPVTTLDINNFQNNIVASGGPDSEIFIWDLKNPSTPLTPGPKTTPHDQISCLAWNKQVQHILASSTQTGRVVVWDLRKSEPIIKVGDQSTMFHYKSIAWHPDIATQILIANEDDRYPVIQMWDLRYATSPMKSMEGHQRGITALSWCPEDSDLLMSCGKDNRILCWDPNSNPHKGEVVYELPTTAQWTSDVCWCPRNPSIVSTTAFDGHITVSTLMGGSQEVQQQQYKSQISDAFGIQQDSFVPPANQQPETLRIEPLKKPPKWMRKPCGARFGFGGKLVSFGNFKEPGQPKQVVVSQVVTETELINRSHELETSLISGHLVEYCDFKITNASDENEKLLWQFLKSNFSSEPRMQFLDLLGYNPQDLAKKISSLQGAASQSVLSDSIGINPAELAQKIEHLQVDSASDTGEKLFGSGVATPLAGDKTPASESEGSALFDQIAAGGSTLPDNTEENIEPEAKPIEPFAISTADDTEGLICQALLTGNFEAAVDVCFNDNRKADGLLLAIAGGPDLFSRTQKRYLAQSQSPVSKVISAVVNRDWRSIVECTVIENWREALSTLVTYSKAEEFSELCCMLGERLENEQGDFNSALLCYICAGDVERMVSCWTRSAAGKDKSPSTLQSLVEKVMVLKKSVETERNAVNVDNTHLAEQLCHYAKMLSSQGNLQTAMMYLSTVNNENVAVLKDRVFRSHGQLQGYPPECPFQRMDFRAQNSNARLPPQSKNKINNTNYYPNSNQAMFTPQPPSPSMSNTFTPSQPPSMGEYTMGASNIAPQPYHSVSQPSPTNPLSQPMPYNPVSQPSYGMSSMHGPPTSLNVASQPPDSQSAYFTPGNALNTQPLQQSFQPQQPSFQAPQPPMPSYNMMQPSTPPALDVGPPPSGVSAPKSLKEVQKELSPSVAQPQPTMNFFNPNANLSQPNMMQQPSMPSMQAPGNPGMGMVPPGRMPPGQTQFPPQPAKKEPEPAKAEVIKDPIPSEHAVLQQTFDSIVERCRNSTNNPQTKRKLEDVRKKLEILYDLLRANRVSPNVLNGLHQMAQACQQRNYITGIQIHTHMISTGNFSEISHFMPGLKTMMQIANQVKI